MNDPLASSRYGIERAKLHIAEFKREEAAWVSSRPYESVMEPDANGAEDLIKICARFVDGPPYCGRTRSILVAA